MQKTLAQASDLDILVSLAPLKLTADQCHAIANALEEATHTDGDIAKQDYDTLRSVAPDIEKARANALNGALPDADTTAKINKALADMGARDAASHTAAMHKIADLLKATLTTDQIKAVEKLYATWNGGKMTIPSTYRDDPEKRNAYIADTALTDYADRILLVQRTLAILKELKSTISPAAPAGDAAPSASPPAAPAPAATTPQ